MIALITLEIKCTCKRARKEKYELEENAETPPSSECSHQGYQDNTRKQSKHNEERMRRYILDFFSAEVIPLISCIDHDVFARNKGNSMQNYQE